MWSGDNGEVTAEDVKYSFERMTNTDWSGRWPTLDKVEVTDKYSGMIILKAPFIPIWLVALSSESGTILPKAAVEKLPDQKFTTELPAECGPYTMAEWQPKQKIILKANPDWQGHQAGLQRSPHHRRRGEQGRGTGLRGRRVATAPTSRRIRRPATSRLRPPNFALLEMAGPYCTWMGMNTRS